MKKYSLLILSFLIINVSAVMAQAENKLNIGAKMGVNFNQLSQTGMHMGANAGGFVLFNVIDKLGIQGELAYNQIGGINPSNKSTIVGGITATAVRRSVSFHNVEIAAVAKYNLGSSEDAFKPKVFGGFSYGYAAAAFEKRDLIFTQGGLSANSGYDYENVGDTYEQHHFAALFGFAIDYTLSTGKIFSTEIRYRRGLNDLANYGALPSSGDAWANTISINFAYSIF
jgi:hypothetical protein